MARVPISADTIVDDLLRDKPECARPFLAHKMLCVGCPVARFHDLGYACDKHDVDLATFFNQLKDVAE